MARRTKLTELHKQRIRESMTGEKNPNFGKNFSEESRAKMSNAQYKRFEDPTEREKLSKTQLERFADPAEREKLSAAQKKRYSNLEERKKISKEVIEIKEDGEVYEYYSAREAQEKTGAKASAICACCKGKRKTAGGSKWFYKVDYLKTIGEAL